MEEVSKGVIQMSLNWVRMGSCQRAGRSPVERKRRRSKADRPEGWPVKSGRMVEFPSWRSG